MSRATNKHMLPATLPRREDADHRRLRVKDGPWCEQQWAVMENSGSVRRTTVDCAVTDCGRPWHLQPGQVALCYPHWWQWHRDGAQPGVAEWAATSARPPQERTRSNSATSRVIDFDLLPPLVALEVRYVVGEKVTAGDWTPNRLLLDILTALTRAVRASDVLSLLDKRPEDWALLARNNGTNQATRNTVTSYLTTFFATLHRGLVVDPWSEPCWLWAGMFDRIVHENSYANRGNNIDWARISQEWIREPLRSYARQCLTTGDRGWSTVVTWSQAARALSAYLSNHGITSPEDLTRRVFLDYLVHLNEREASPHALAGVNTIASVLADVQAEGLASYGSAVFLRYAENRIPKKRQPRPYPQDVIARVDSVVLADPKVERSARLMLQLTRWGGLRISELITCPIDVLRHTPSKGYWVHYYMSKTRSWRSFPVPDDLAQALVEQRTWVEQTYGRDAEYLFPSPTRSSQARQQVRPWSQEGFRKHMRTAFARHGIHTSTITGEHVTGGEIHRYRHTIGTALLNAGWSQREVQEFLGHMSAQMTANYAEILDDTIIRKVREFREQGDAQKSAEATENPSVERLRARFTYELPDGGCTLPASQTCETRDNPCSGCAFYDSGGADLRHVHEDRRKRLRVHVDQTTDPRERALNQQALDAVEQILDKAN